MIVLDLETGPLPWGLLQALIPAFDEAAAVPDPGPFDPAGVAIGNLKDPAKIDLKISQAREAHALSVKTVAVRRAEARNNYNVKAIEKAALSPCTGMIKAIGLMTDVEMPEEATLFYPGCSDNVQCEADLIKGFWRYFQGAPTATFVGHNIYGFDLPFLVRRSWLLGIDVPKGFMQPGKYQRWSHQFIDTMDVWGCGSREYVKLDDIAKAMGIPGKSDGCTGADFARMFDAGGDERKAALAYLRQDLVVTKAVAEAMGIL